MSSRTLGLVVFGVAVVLALAVALRLVGGPETGRYDDPSGPSATGEVPPAAESARVASHVDGDTIRLVGEDGSGVLPEDRETVVRLLEIDTPEHASSGSPEECYADEASSALRDMLPVGAQVLVEADRELLDRYGRTLLYLWTSDGELVNLEMVRQGYARAVLYEPNDAHIDRMRQAEQQAWSEARGLWGAAC